MKNQKLFGICLSIFVCIMLFGVTANAQPGSPGNPDAPIDGGLSLLIAAGAGYGIKKVRDERKKERKQQFK